jgi:hypothetical protein
VPLQKDNPVFSRTLEDTAAKNSNDFVDAGCEAAYERKNSPPRSGMACK